MNEYKKMILEIIEKTNQGIELSASQKRVMTGMGKSRERFVKEMLKLLKEDDSFLPRNYNSEQLCKHYKMYSGYKELLEITEDLKKQLYNHYIEYGTQSFTEALRLKKLLDNNPSEEYKEKRKRISNFFSKKKKS